MLSFFKSKKNKAQKKGGSFYHRENLIQTIEELNNMLNQPNSSGITLSDANILFQGFELDSIIKKNLEDDFGEESFLLEPEGGIEGHKVYFYRIVSDYFRFLIQIHFIDDKFFFSATKVYSESVLSLIDKKKVIKQIANKYHLTVNNETINFNIKDPAGNMLFTHDDVYYHIKYLPNNQINKELKKQYQGFKKADPAEEIKETLDRLI